MDSSNIISTENIESATNNVMINTVSQDVLHQQENSTLVEIQPAETETQIDGASASNQSLLFTKELKKDLKSNYRKLQLPIQQWMSTESVPVELCYSQIDLSDGENKIDLSHIFCIGGSSNDEAKSVRRILVESLPGYGKTVLAIKLAYDWACGVSYMKQFKLVYLITRENFVGNDVFEAAANMSNAEIPVSGQFKEMINDSSTLIILDGLDEFKSNQRQKVLKMLCGTNRNNEMTIITTCRTGLFKLDENEKKMLFKNLPRSSDFWDRKITVCGVKKELRYGFVEKFANGANNTQCDIKQMLKIAEKFDSPLILTFLAYLKSQDVVNFENTTDVYKGILNYLIKSHYEKSDSSPETNTENFDLFTNANFSENSNLLVIAKFGQLCIDNAGENLSQFKPDEIINEIYELGLLTRTEFGQDIQYQCCHRSILEFCAAISLWADYKVHGKFNSDTIEKINGIHLKTSDASLVIPFLCGLMGKEVTVLFNLLQPFSALFSTNDTAMTLILNECPNENVVAASVANLYPHVMSLADSNFSSLDKNILHEKGNRKILEKLDIQSDQLSNVFHGLLVKDLNISVKGQFPTASRSCVRDSIQCDKLTLRFNDASLCEKDVKDYLALLHANSIRYREICFGDAGIYSTFLSSVKNNGLKVVAVDSVQCVLDGSTEEKELVNHLITRFKLKNLTLIVQNDRYLNDVIDCAAASDHLTLITIIGSMNQKKVEVDISGLTKDDRKVWDFVALQNVSVANSSHTNTVKHISSCMINECETDDNIADALQFIAPILLDCDINVLNLMGSNNYLKSWSGLNTISDLMLNIRQSNETVQCLKHLEKFVNLKSLRILIETDLNDCNQKVLTHSLSPLKITQLGFLWGEHGFECITSVIDKLRDLMGNGGLKNLVRIDTYVLSYNAIQDKKYKAVVKSLLECLEVRPNHLTVNFIFDTLFKAHSILKLNVIDHSKFKVSHVTDHSYRMKNYSHCAVIDTYNMLQVQCKTRWQIWKLLADSRNVVNGLFSQMWYFRRNLFFLRNGDGSTSSTFESLERIG